MVLDALFVLVIRFFFGLELGYFTSTKKFLFGFGTGLKKDRTRNEFLGG